MLFSDATFIGIDPTAGKRPFVFAAIDHELQLLALDQGRIDDALAFTLGQSKALVAVCAPRQPNQGVMAQPAVREALAPQPSPGRWLNFRLSDFLLRKHNINIPQTGARIEDCPNWMRMGFTLFHRLAASGYKPYPQAKAQRQFLEVYPHACFAVLMGILPFPKHSLEGRLQRQLVLFEQKINVPDPMRIFEEITRHRLLKGILPLEDIYTPEELDALVAAYTAWYTAFHPDQITLLGDPDEGQVVLPVSELKGRYS